MNRFKKRMEELGGVAFSPEKNRDLAITDASIEKIKQKMGKLPEKQVIDFMKSWGYASFNEDVRIVPVELPPVVTISDPDCPIDEFFGLGEGQNSILEIINAYFKDEQINEKFFPICNGCPGDIIFYSLEDDSFGKIYYWYHEGVVGATNFLIAENFTSFIDNLKKINAETESVDKKDAVKFTSVSPLMLALLNNERKNKGLPPLTKEDLLDA